MPPYTFKIHFSGHEEVAYYEAHEGKLLGADVYLVCSFSWKILWSQATGRPCAAWLIHCLLAPQCMN